VDADWVIGVTATDEQDGEPSFTNYGSSCADLSAPGVSISGLTYDGGDGGTFTGDQGAWDGTSAASPMVAGAAALILSAYPELSPAQVRTALKLSVDPLGEMTSARGALGVGRLNIAQALAVASTLVGPTGASAPTDTATDTTTVPDDHFTENAHFSFIALGGNPGDEPRVRVYRADGETYASFLAYGATFKGGMSLATGDFDEDAIPEVVTGAGPGGGPHVRVFSADGSVLHQFFPYDTASRKGVNVAVGDADGDGVQDIVTAVGAGVSNEVILFDETGKEKSRFTVKDFAPGIPLHVAVGDVDDDFAPEVVVFAGSGEPRVSLYQHDGTPLVSFLAYGVNMTAGMSLSLGDFDGDSRDEIITAPNAGSQHIRIFNKIGALFGQFFAEPQGVSGGARVSVTDIDVDGVKDVVVIPAAAKGDVRVFSSKGTLLKTVGTDLVPLKGAQLSAW
jgi:hypothetical protein